VEDLRRWLWWATVALGLVLVGTGGWLSLFYRPPGQKAFNSTTTGPQFLHVVHWVAALLFLAVLVGLAVSTVVAWTRTGPVAVGVVVVAVALLWTGTLLPWDQLALWAVTVGTNIRGFFTAAFDDQVKFVLIGGVEISRATLRAWFVVHAFVLPVAGVACLAWLRRRSSTVEGAGA
jgi:quinol-cytochrome oxidoreductase complex cytochrome b subunit